MHELAQVTTSSDIEIIHYRGIKLACAPGVVEGRVRTAIDEGWYEDEESRNVPYLLQPGERVLELGSGLGFLTALVARDRRVESVLTFEANPQLVALVERTAALNGVAEKVSVRNAVAVPEPGNDACDFYLRDEFWASSLQGAPWGYREKISVPMVDLNAEIAAFGPTLLMVDIEGGELDLFEKVELGPVLKIFVELHQGAIGRKGMLRVFQALAARSFHYDQWHSEKSVVLFSRVDRDEITQSA